MSNNEISLKTGARYHVKMTEEDEVYGIFRGYSSLGGDVALVIERRENGMMRFIPLSQIIYIDQLDKPEAEEEPKKIDIYYR